MRKISTYIIVLLLLAFNLEAQNKTLKAGDAMCTSNNGTYLGTFQPKEGDAALLPEFRSIRDEVNKTQHQEDLARYKDSIRKFKRSSTRATQGSSNKTLSAIDPVKTLGFNALGNLGTPSDNAIAVGNDGTMIAAVNSSLRVYTTAGSAVGGTKSFPFFWRSITSKTNMCDPLVHYDPEYDRFIVFTQVCDRGTADNRILVAFSTTNDPSGTYHYYSFRANLRELIGTSYPYDVWFDYPKMAVSENDLFITGNLFRNISGSISRYVESAVFQIDKVACFAGNANPSAVIFNAVDGRPFTIVPAGHGRDANYGNTMHMCATVNSNSSNVVRMYTVNGRANSNPTISRADVTVPTYSQPGDAVQPGTNIDLNTGDLRGMSAIYVDGTVHFVFHSNGPGSYVAINYNRFKRSGNTWSVQNKLISIPNVDCGYPSVASMGWTDQDQSALIVFDYSSLTDYPGIRAIFVDNNMNVSDYEELSSGTNYASAGNTTSGSTRWGDYTGIARQHNATVPTVWGFGMYAATGNDWRNYISKIETTAEQPEPQDTVSEEVQSVQLFPNPVLDFWSIKLNLVQSGLLSVDIFDAQGKKVKNVISENVSAGEAAFSFNKNGLANGAYFVRITINDKLVSNEKIIVAK